MTPTVETGRSAPCLDPIEQVPSPDALRVIIRDHVRRVEVLRHLLRVALRREQLGLAGPASAKREEVGRG